MDRESAITHFVECVDLLPSLPFITNIEMKNLYGEEVTSALGKLERLNQEKMICQNCNNNCCQEHGCEFYAPHFSQCPIHDFRPAICRFHFCDKFQIVASTDIKELIKELSEIFLYSLSIAARSGSHRVVFFNPPPFADVLPKLIEEITPLVNKVQLGQLSPREGQRYIKQKVIKYHAIGMPLQFGDSR